MSTSNVKASDQVYNLHPMIKYKITTAILASLGDEYVRMVNLWNLNANLIRANFACPTSRDVIESAFLQKSANSLTVKELCQNFIDCGIGEQFKVLFSEIYEEIRGKTCAVQTPECEVSGAIP